MGFEVCLRSNGKSGRSTGGGVVTTCINLGRRNGRATRWHLHKERVASFVTRYGLKSTFTKAYGMVRNTRGTSHEELYDKLPYLGYIDVPFTINEDGECVHKPGGVLRLKMKVIEVRKYDPTNHDLNDIVLAHRAQGCVEFMHIANEFGRFGVSEDDTLTLDGKL